jgi:hypothetical protein
MSANSTPPPGEIAGASSTGTFAIQVVSESNSYSEINWAAISVKFLWCLGMVLLGAVLALAWQDKRRLRAANASSQEQDIEASNMNNNEQEQADVSSFTGACLYLAIPMFTALTAFYSSIVPHMSCEYLGLSEEDDHELISLGLWKVVYSYDNISGFSGEGICLSNFRTASFQVDAALTIARVAAILASTIGGICMLVLLNTVASSGKLDGQRRLVEPLLVATFFQGLTLSIHASDQCQASTSCYVDNGALSAMTSTFYWFLCAVAILCVPHASQPRI